MNLATLTANEIWLVVGLVLSFVATCFSKPIADALFTPKSNGHPAVNIFKVVFHLITWLLLPVVGAVCFMFFALLLLHRL